MFDLSDPSKRRLLVTLLAPLFSALFSWLGSKGFPVAPEHQSLLIELAIAYVLAGNLKEALIKRAEVAGAKAAAAVATPADAAAVLKAAVEAEKAAQAAPEVKP